MQELKNTYLITIDRELIHEYHLYYLKTHPKCRTLPFAKPKNIKEFNKNGTPKLTKSGKQKTKKQAVSKKDYTINDCIYGAMSLNDILIINDRLAMNNKKEQWGDLGIWIANKYNLKGLNISNCMVEFRVYSETLAQKDNDNISAGIKFLNDGLFVKSHLVEDDNYFHINPLLINCSYDKEHPRTEIRISVFEDNLKDVYKKLAIHIKNFEK